MMVKATVRLIHQSVANGTKLLLHSEKPALLNAPMARNAPRQSDDGRL